MGEKVWVKTLCENFVKRIGETRWVKSIGENIIKSMGKTLEIVWVKTK